jgi:hypothetical protein
MTERTVSDAREKGRQVFKILDAEMGSLRNRGLKDLKAKVFVSRDTTVQGLSLVLSNVIRRYKAGEAAPVEIV